MSMFACVMAIIYALFGVFAAAIYGVFQCGSPGIHDLGTS